MQRRLFTTIVLIYFAILLGGPLWLWVSGVRNTSIENTALSERPEFDAQKFYAGEYSEQLSRYIVEQNPVRPTAIQSNSWLNYHLFKDGQQGRVLQGKDGWLFYQPSVVRGCPPKGRGLAIKQYLQQFVDVLSTKERTVLLSVAPNKYSIYPEYGSARIRLIEKCALQNNLEIRGSMSGIQTQNHIDIFELLASQKSENPSQNLYSDRDTHWTNYAAALYGKEVLERSGSRVSLAREPIPLDKFLYKRSDLSSMLGLGEKTQKPLYQIHASTTGDADLPHSAVKRSYIPRARRAQLHISEQAKPGGEQARQAQRVVIIHDSFMYSIWQTFANHFDQVLFVHWNATPHLDMTKLLAAADVVIVESVERHAAKSFGERLPHAVSLQSLSASVKRSNQAENERAWAAVLAYKRKPRKLF